MDVMKQFLSNQKVLADCYQREREFLGNRQIELTPDELSALQTLFRRMSYVFLLSSGPLASVAMKTAAAFKRMEKAK